MTLPRTAEDASSPPRPRGVGAWASRIGRFLGYSFLALVLGAIGFSLVIALLSAGAATVVVWVGLPILVGGVLVARGFAAAERALQSAILGTYALVKRPWVVEDENGNDAIAIKPMMNITLTYDHRLVDGFGAQFDADLAGGQVEAAHEVGAGVGLREHDGDRLPDGDAQVLDGVDGEVEAGRERRRGGAEHGRERAVGRQPHLGAGARGRVVGVRRFVNHQRVRSLMMTPAPCDAGWWGHPSACLRAR